MNLLINTGVASDDKRPRGLPPDDRFGSATGLFNPPPLVEAADTGPWFHANSRSKSLKEAIEFYDGDAFKKRAFCSRGSSSTPWTHSSAS